jgi:hypothetical protein
MNAFFDPVYRTEYINCFPIAAEDVVWGLTAHCMSFRAPPHCSLSVFTADASAGTPCRSPHQFPFRAKDDGRLRPAADDFACRILMFVQKLRLILRIDICIRFARLLLSFPSSISHIPSREAPSCFFSFVSAFLSLRSTNFKFASDCGQLPIRPPCLLSFKTEIRSRSINAQQLIQAPSRDGAPHTQRPSTAHSSIVR